MITDYQRFVRFCFEQLIVGRDVGSSLIVRYLAFGRVRILFAQQGCDVLQPQAVVVQLRGIDFYAHGR